jgi:hypothetical protein
LAVGVEKTPEEPVVDALPDGEQDVGVSAEKEATPTEDLESNDLESTSEDQSNSEGEPTDV